MTMTMAARRRSTRRCGPAAALTLVCAAGGCVGTGSETRVLKGLGIGWWLWALHHQHARPAAL